MSDTSLRLYNTFSKREEDFVSIDEERGRTLRLASLAQGEDEKHPRVLVYTCGPTVYGRPHIGNYSSFLMADLLVRWLEVKGFKVTHAKNITDVGHLVADRDEGEDKVEKQAKAENVDPLAIARKYEAQYLEDEKALNMREPEARPRATETIREMIIIIKDLLKNGHAYETSDGIYFDVYTFKDYGKLSGNLLKDLEAGARVEVDEKKKHPADFALWKKCVGGNAEHLLRWDFSSGDRVYTTGDDASAGFPGWHIECSAMSRKHLGERIDIHTGGEDNIFPHHECEIAQSECAPLSGAEGSGPHPFAKIWLHKRRIDMGDVKMSKSLGNILTLPDIVSQGFSPLDLRYYLLSVHYRTNLKFTWKGLEDAKKARRKIVEWMEEVEEEWATDEIIGDDHRLDAITVAGWRLRFEQAMDADLNTPETLALIFDVMSLSRHKQKYLVESGLSALHTFINVVRRTFGCFEPEADIVIPEDVQTLLDERAEARAKKDFASSDALRKQIEGKGYVVRDVPEGQRVMKR